MPLPHVAIIILNWNGKADTIECLQSISALVFPHDRIGVFVADNASDDGSQEDLRAEIERMQNQGFRDLDLLEFETNLGFARGNNRALESVPSTYEYIFCVNNDVAFFPDSLDRLVECLLGDPAAGIVGPKVLAHGQPGRLAHGAGFIRPFFCGTRSADAPVATPCDFVTGCALLMRREALEAIGGMLFDPDYFAYWEDTDLCLRIRKAGFQVIYCPEASLLHKVGASSGADEAAPSSPARIYYDIHSRMIFARKHAGFLTYLIFLALFAIRIPAFILVALARSPRTAYSRTAAYLRGLAHGLAGRPGRSYMGPG